MELYAELMSEYLNTAPDQAWLYSACDSNYDGNGQLIRWMIDQPTCPQAAALAVFWYSGAGYYGQFQSRDDVPSHAKDTYDFLQTIQDRLLAGFYRVTEIGFDPRNDPTPIGSLSKPGLDWTTQYEGGVNVPEAMKQAIPGSNLGVMDMPEGWVEGMPPEIYEQVEASYEDEDEEED